MLGGFAVVGVLLAVLVALSPGGSTPRLPAQTVHDVGPVLTVGPKTAAATTPPSAEHPVHHDLDPPRRSGHADHVGTTTTTRPPPTTTTTTCILILCN